MNHMFGPLKQHLGGSEVQSGEEVKTAFGEWIQMDANGCKCQSLISSGSEFVNLCQAGRNASICSNVNGNSVK
jgi:hypothetical protein